jgi:vitellogenic carboxypeptidase-like protein
LSQTKPNQTKPNQQKNTTTPPFFPQLIVWLQGGPGCSSLLGLMMENGPLRIQPDGTTKPNPYAWTNDYRVLYVDNPIGTGFSYVLNEAGYLDAQPAVANELYTAIDMVLATYPHLAGVDVYVAGESYAGKWIPSIAHRILQANAKSAKPGGKPKINLKGVAIGDGMSDPVSQVSTYADYAYQTSLIDLKEKRKVEARQQKVLSLIGKGSFDDAWKQWDDVINGIMNYAGGASSYDIRLYSKLDIRTPAGYIRGLASKLHVGKHEFQECNHKVYHHMRADMMKSVRDLYPELIKNIRVLIYHGQWDLVCNAPGINKFLSNVEWDGRAAFADADRKIWKVHGKPAGYIRSYKNLAQLTVLGAGHMVPMDRAETGARMIRRFIEGKGLFETD